jgi:hypothetical protein
VVQISLISAARMDWLAQRTVPLIRSRQSVESETKADFARSDALAIL